MPTRMIPVDDLEVGDVLALPFNRTATVSHIDRGPRITRIRTEHGMHKRESRGEVMIEVPDTTEDAKARLRALLAESAHDEATADLIAAHRPEFDALMQAKLDNLLKLAKLDD